MRWFLLKDDVSWTHRQELLWRSLSCECWCAIQPGTMRSASSFCWCIYQRMTKFESIESRLYKKNDRQVLQSTYGGAIFFAGYVDKHNRTVLTPHQKRRRYGELLKNAVCCYLLTNIEMNTTVPYELRVRYRGFFWLEIYQNFTKKRCCPSSTLPSFRPFVSCSRHALRLGLSPLSLSENTTDDGKEVMRKRCILRNYVFYETINAISCIELIFDTR